MIDAMAYNLLNGDLRQFYEDVKYVYFFDKSTFFILLLVQKNEARKRHDLNDSSGLTQHSSMYSKAF